jgi:acetyl/propionyl-CoA carboxylase alpha subunit
MKWVVNGQPADLVEAEGIGIRQIGEKFFITEGGKTHSAAVVKKGDNVLVSTRGRVFEITRAQSARASAKGGGSGNIMAPMPGVIISVAVEVNQMVKQGDALLVMEAMKTQQTLNAPFDGKVISVKVNPGEQVSDGQTLVNVESLS